MRCDEKTNMQHFFDVGLFQQIASGLVVLLVSIWLGAKSGPTTYGKGWKIIVIIGWMMILGGLYTAGLNSQHGGFSNPYTGLGLSLFILGIPVMYLGKFFVWWHR